MSNSECICEKVFFNPMYLYAVGGVVVQVNNARDRSQSTIQLGYLSYKEGIDYLTTFTHQIFVADQQQFTSFQHAYVRLMMAEGQYLVRVFQQDDLVTKIPEQFAIFTDFEIFKSKCISDPTRLLCQRIESFNQRRINKQQGLVQIDELVFLKGQFEWIYKQKTDIAVKESCDAQYKLISLTSVVLTEIIENGLNSRADVLNQLQGVNWFDLDNTTTIQ